MARAAWWLTRAIDGLAYIENVVRLAPEGPLFRWALGYTYALVGRVDDAAKQAEWLAENAVQLPYTAQLRALVAALQGRNTDALALLATVNIATLDGHHTFHLSESYAMAGDIERAMALAFRAVELGFYPYTGITRLCPFYAPLREAAGFDLLAAKAAERVAQFDAAFAS